MSQQGSCRCCVSFSFLSTRHTRNHSILPYHERLPLLLVVSLAKWWHAEVGHRTRHDNIETHRNSKISGNLWNIFGNWPTFFSSQCLELLCLRHALLLTCCLRLQNIRRENHKRKELPKVSHMQKWKMCMKNEWKNVLNIHHGIELNRNCQMLNLFHQLQGSTTPQGLFVLQPGFVVFDFNLCLAKWWKAQVVANLYIHHYSSIISLGPNVQKSLSVFLFTCCFYLSWLSLPAVCTICSRCLDNRQYTSKVFRISPCEAMSSMYLSVS